MGFQHPHCVVILEVAKKRVVENILSMLVDLEGATAIERSTLYIMWEPSRVQRR